MAASPNPNVPEPKQWWRSALTAIAGVVVGGGILSAMLTWYLSKPSDTVVSYSITSTALGASPDVQNVVPDVKMEVGNRRIQALYIYTVDLSAQSGPFVNDATIALVFPKQVDILRLKSVAPSPLHHFDCTFMANGLAEECRLGPLDATKHLNTFEATIATTSETAPVVQAALPHFDLVNTTQYLSEQKTKADRYLAITQVMVFIAIIISSFFRLRASPVRRRA